MLLLAKIHILLLLLWVAEAQHVDNSPKELLISHEAKTDLMKLDKVLIENLQEYLNKLEEKITKLRKIVDEIRQPLETAKGVEEEYLSNPLNSFPLIRHMHQDWKYLKDFMQKPVGEEQINFLKETLPELPMKSDGDEATQAMFRMARTYNATPWDMAHGFIDGIQYRNSLTALDCFEIGKLYLKWGFINEASQWLYITSMFNLDSNLFQTLGLDPKDLALMLARSLAVLGQDNEALKVLEKHPDLAENQTSLLALFKAYSSDPPKGIPHLPEEYSKLCQSSHVSSPSRLHCRYNHTTSPFLILAPLKMEEISLDPYITVYHDVISVKKTEEIIRFAEPRLNPTYIFSPEEGQVKHPARTALGTWVHEEDMNSTDLPFHNLYDKIRDITGLNVDDSDEIQLLKYGFGAHYCPHHDYFNGSAPDIESHGDRIATALFYLNDAPHGGATAFTDLNIKVPAERGKVLFWYNLRGETHDFDFPTTHAACPVFQGFKFVMTVWIRELNQMFIQPAYREGSRTYFF
ncbi:prolyl 4-hydroxylase subunit alpha-1-like [Drosophila kikkawai]|uniref:procollagen-proline 4-dioxygenase n=1 Tax=Drosophila kikkawai TaxID=30033 RepID=A0A6P4HYS4_DROKI|nr:prolyl 4-hydroxylase subunit alpha-1-like [Drosophila kikkawai]